MRTSRFRCFGSVSVRGGFGGFMKTRDFAAFLSVSFYRSTTCRGAWLRSSVVLAWLWSDFYFYFFYFFVSSALDRVLSFFFVGADHARLGCTVVRGVVQCGAVLCGPMRLGVLLLASDVPGTIGIYRRTYSSLVPLRVRVDRAQSSPPPVRHNSTAARGRMGDAFHT